MSVDENYWPGPTWDFTIHVKGFPASPADGDLYLNASGLMYIYVRGEFISLSMKEWNELLVIGPIQGVSVLSNKAKHYAVVYAADFSIEGNIYNIGEGDTVTIEGVGEYECILRFPREEVRLYLINAYRSDAPVIIYSLTGS